MTFPRAMAWLLTTTVALLSESATKPCLAQTANQASPPTQQAGDCICSRDPIGIFLDCIVAFFLFERR
jgi:hypothetical protein